MKWEILDNLVKKKLKNEKSGHGYDHAKRVLNNALKIAKQHKNVDYDVLIASCWLHDIGFSTKCEPKLHHVYSAKMTNSILKKFDFPRNKMKQVYHVIINHNRSYAPKNTLPNTINELSKEAKIVLDADNLECFGNIGVERVIAFSKKQGLPRFISKKDKVDQSLYGNAKYLIKRSKAMVTREGEKIVKKRLKPLNKLLKKLEKES